MPVPTRFRNGVLSANDGRRARRLMEDTFNGNACPPSRWRQDIPPRPRPFERMSPLRQNAARYRSYRNTTPPSPDSPSVGDTVWFDAELSLQNSPHPLPIETEQHPIRTTSPVLSDPTTWFDAMRPMGRAPPRPATPAQQPRPNQLAAQFPAIQNEVAPSPVRAVTPRILPAVPNDLPGSPSHVRVRTKVTGREFAVQEGPSGINLKNGRMVFYPKIVDLTLPEPKLVYPECMFDQFLHKRDQEITDEEEAIFRKVLLAKMKCQICSQGLVTLRCVECCNTICNTCVVGLAHAMEPHIAHRIQCPYCRHQVKPFVPLSLLR